MTTTSKKRHVLCVFLSSVILIQSAIFVFANNYRFNSSLLTISTLLLSIIMLLLLWLFVSPILESKVKFENEVNTLKKFKRNFNFFQYHSKSIEEYDGFEDLKGITFGDKNTTTQITLILSPNCNNCHKTFKEAYQLFQNNSEKIHLSILFNINPNNPENPNNAVAENLLALNEQNPGKAKEALIDWHINRLDIKTWKRKWTIETPYLPVNKQLQNQYFWCLKNAFDYTPVKIINDNLFPDEYEISELNDFINDFQEEFKYEEALKVV